jgi:C-terminal processing protease CtpA/Prc
LDALAREPYTYQRAVRLRAVRYGDLPNFISTWGDRDALFNPPMENFITTTDGRFDLRPDLAPDILMPRQPASYAFQGPVTVLIGPANASGATMTIAKLRDMGRVTLVGASSGGSAEGPTAGTIFNVALPNSGIVVRVPLALNLMDVRAPDPAGGVAPDIEVHETVRDFRSRFDRTLAVAIESQR